MINYRPLSITKDAMKAYIVPEKPLAFASTMDFLPVASHEVYRIAGWYPVVIKENEQGSLQWGMPVQTQDFTNCLVNPEKGRWMGQQLPVFIGRYPFASVSPAQQPDQLVLCVDDNATTFQDVTYSELQHSRVMLDEQGELTEHGQRTRQAVEQYEKCLCQDREALMLLKSWELLEPWRPDFDNFPKAKQLNFSMPLEGLYMINEAKLQTLTPEQVQQLFARNGFKMIYAHRMSLLRVDSVAHFNQFTKSRVAQIRPVDDGIVTKMFDDDDEFGFNFDNI